MLHNFYVTSKKILISLKGLFSSVLHSCMQVNIYQLLLNENTKKNIFLTSTNIL